MAEISRSTFEGGSLTGADGATSSSGSDIAITSSGPILGLYSVLVDTGGNSNLSWTVSAINTIYVACYVVLLGDAGSTKQLVQVRDSGSNVLASIRLKTDDEFALYNSGGSMVGVEYAATQDQVYRVCLRYTRSTGSNGVIAMYIAEDNDAFGSAHASNSSHSATAQVTNVRIGTFASPGFDAKFDEVVFDNSTPPAPSSVPSSYLGLKRQLNVYRM